MDGNFGGAAGVGEMLLQSHEGSIRLLPALPDCWDEGRFRGMRVRGGASVDLDWKQGHAKRAVVTARVSGTFILKMPAGASKATLVRDGTSVETCTSDKITLNLKAGESCELRFE